MQSLFDARKVAYDLLDECKAVLQEKGYLPPFGVVLEPAGKVTPVALDLTDREAKKRSVQVVGQLARDTQAVAVIILTDSTYRVFPREENDPTPPCEDPEFKHSFKPDGKPRNCTSMEIRIQGQTPTIVMVPYWKDIHGNIVVGTPEEGPLDFRGPEPPTNAEDPLTKD